MHPSLMRPILSKVQPMHTDVIHFENYAGFDNIRENILTYVTISFLCHHITVLSGL